MTQYQQKPRTPHHDPFAEPLPFYLTVPSPSQLIPLPQSQKSLLNSRVSAQSYRPEDSLNYLQPCRTFEYKNYQLFTEDERLLKESTLSPGPASAPSLGEVSGGRFLLGQDIERIKLAAPGPGSYSPSAKVRIKIPCSTFWRSAPTPSSTEQAAIQGANSAGPGAFLGLSKLPRIGSVSWGTGVGGRFDTKEADTTGPLLGPGSYTIKDTRDFGKSGSSVIIRAEHGTAAVIRSMKEARGGGGGGGIPNQKDTTRACSPRNVQTGSKEATQKVLKKALQKTIDQIVTMVQKELEKDEQERLSLACSVSNSKLKSSKFKRIDQRRMTTRNRIGELTKKKDRLIRALMELNR